MNCIFFIILELDNDLFTSCTSYTSCTIFGKKNHLHLFVLKAKKVDADPKKYSTMVPKNTSHWKKKKEGASTMSKSNHRR